MDLRFYFALSALSSPTRTNPAPWAGLSHVAPSALISARPATAPRSGSSAHSDPRMSRMSSCSSQRKRKKDEASCLRHHQRAADLSHPLDFKYDRSRFLQSPGNQKVIIWSQRDERPQISSARL